MDNHTKSERSYNMSRIKSKNTKPEEIVRKWLFSRGFRYRKYVKNLPGCPDIVLPKYRTVIFVNGCFWHVHEGCPKFVWPQSNIEYWNKKLNRNKKRDENNIRELLELGWKTIVIWECQLNKNNKDENLNLLAEKIKDNCRGREVGDEL